MALDTNELIHHILPSTVGTGVMFSLGEDFLLSVAAGVSIWIITHGLSALWKKVMRGR